MNLNELAELSWQKNFPAGSDETAIPKESFMRVAFAEFAYFTLLASYNERAQEGYYEVPSYLLSETELEVNDGEMDISSLKTFKSLPNDIWLVNIGGVNCECEYVKTTANLNQLLCDDNSLPDSARTYYIVGKKIKFPKGAHKDKLPIVFANMGKDLQGSIEVSEAIGSMVRDKLDAIYSGKVPPTDTTNNSNPNG